MRDNNLAHLSEILKLGVCSFKVFTCMPYEASGEAIMKMMDFSSDTGAFMRRWPAFGLSAQKIYSFQGTGGRTCSKAS